MSRAPLAAAGVDPASKGGAPRDLARCVQAQLGALRDALEDVNDGSYSEGLLSPGRGHSHRQQLGASVMSALSAANATAKLDLTQPWKPAGQTMTAAGGGGGGQLGASGIKVKGGGSVVKSSAAKPTVRLSEAEMAANWEALS